MLSPWEYKEEILKRIVKRDIIKAKMIKQKEKGDIYADPNRASVTERDNGK